MEVLDHVMVKVIFKRLQERPFSMMVGALTINILIVMEYSF